MEVGKRHFRLEESKTAHAQKCKCQDLAIAKIYGQMAYLQVCMCRMASLAATSGSPR